MTNIASNYTYAYLYCHCIDEPYLFRLFYRSMTKIKILDASGPPGLPTLLGGVSETTVNTAISVLSFSPDGEVPFLLLISQATTLSSCTNSVL